MDVTALYDTQGTNEWATTEAKTQFDLFFSTLPTFTSFARPCNSSCAHAQMRVVICEWVSFVNRDLMTDGSFISHGRESKLVIATIATHTYTHTRTYTHTHTHTHTHVSTRVHIRCEHRTPMQSLYISVHAFSLTINYPRFRGVAESKWMNHLASILRGAVTVASAADAGEPCVVHCSDGWDRTSQVTVNSRNNSVGFDSPSALIRGFYSL